jgi:hypothetical protein
VRLPSIGIQRGRRLARLADEDDDFFGGGNIQLVPRLGLVEVLDSLVDLERFFLSVVKQMPDLVFSVGRRQTAVACSKLRLLPSWGAFLDF